MNDQILSLAELIWLKKVRADLGVDTTPRAADEAQHVRKAESDKTSAESQQTSKSQRSVQTRRKRQEHHSAHVDVSSTQDGSIAAGQYETPVITELPLPFKRVELVRALHRVATWREDVANGELHLEDTVQQTARNGGMVTLVYQTVQRQDTQVIFIQDRSPSMSPWRSCCQQLSEHLTAHQSFAGVSHVWTDLSSSMPHLELMKDQGEDLQARRAQRTQNSSNQTPHVQESFTSQRIKALGEISRVAEKLLILLYSDGAARSLTNRRFARLLRGLEEPYELVLLNPWVESQWQRNAVSDLFPTEPRVVTREDTTRRAVPLTLVHPEGDGFLALSNQRVKGKSVLKAVMLATPRLIGEPRQRASRTQGRRSAKRATPRTLKVDYQFKVAQLLSTLSPTSRELLVLSAALPGVVTTHLWLAIGQRFLKELLGLSPSPTEVRTAMSEVLTSGLFKAASQPQAQQRSIDDEVYVFVNDEARSALRACLEPRSELALQRALLALLRSNEEAWRTHTVYHQIRVGLTILEEPDQESLALIHELPTEMLVDLRSRVSSSVLVSHLDEAIAREVEVVEQYHFHEEIMDETDVPQKGVHQGQDEETISDNATTPEIPPKPRVSMTAFDLMRELEVDYPTLVKIARFGGVNIKSPLTELRARELRKVITATERWSPALEDQHLMEPTPLEDQHLMEPTPFQLDLDLSQFELDLASLEVAMSYFKTQDQINVWAVMSYLKIDYEAIVKLSRDAGFTIKSPLTSLKRRELTKIIEILQKHLREYESSQETPDSDSPSITPLSLTPEDDHILKSFVEALEGYNGHEEHLPDGFLQARDPIYQQISDLIYRLLDERELKTRRLGRSKINQLFGFKHTLDMPEITEALGSNKAFLGLFAVPHLWQLTPKGDPLLEELRLRDIHGDRETQLEQRRGLFVLLAYQLPTRRSMNGYTGQEFQAGLRDFVDWLKQYNIGDPCLFNLGSRTHIGVVAHVSSRAALQANPKLELAKTLDRFEEICILLDDFVFSFTQDTQFAAEFKRIMEGIGPKIQTFLMDEDVSSTSQHIERPKDVHHEEASCDVDLVLVIDATGSMDPFLDQVKAHGLSFYNDLKDTMTHLHKPLNHLRVRVIVYRDYYADREDNAMVESPFFNLPKQTPEFESFLQSIVAEGGGDEPESGLEALALAINSDWSSVDDCRHVIALWTDASAHPFSPPRKVRPSFYPNGMPEDLEQLTQMWRQDMNTATKRLIIYAPDVKPWSQLSESWENVIHHEAQAASGLSDADYDVILRIITNTI